MALNRPIHSFHGKKVWIIGASSGIGSALSKELMNNGAWVAMSARRVERLTEIQTPDKSEALIIPLDVTHPETIFNAHETILKSWGAIDLMIYVSGVYHPLRAWDLNRNKIQTMIETNLTGAMLACDTVIQGMLAHHSGGVAIVSSVSGYRGLPKALIYGPTKAALINYAETLYYDLHDKGISTYLINPGFVKTEATAQNDFYMPALISAEEAAKEILKGIQKGYFEIHFPKRFTLWLQLFRLLPYSIYFWLIKKLLKI